MWATPRIIFFGSQEIWLKTSQNILNGRTHNSHKFDSQPELWQPKHGYEKVHGVDPIKQSGLFQKEKCFHNRTIGILMRASDIIGVQLVTGQMLSKSVLKMKEIIRKTDRCGAVRIKNGGNLIESLFFNVGLGF